MIAKTSIAALAAPGSAPTDLLRDDAAWASTDPWIGFGRKLMIGLLGVMLISSFISISGAVVASGTVSVESNYKAVQHLEGGIVTKILAKNGDQVRQGDVLLRLDDAQIRASLGVIKGRLADAVVQRARLEAERDDKGDFSPRSQLGASTGDLQVMRMIEAQQTLFAARRLTKLGEQSVLKQRIEQTSTDLGGIEHQLTSRSREFDLASRELKNVLPLFEKGFVNQQRIGPLQRDVARLDGELGRLQGDYAKAQSALTEAKLKLEQSEKEFKSGVADELRKVQSQVTEASETRAGLEDKLSRTEIRAPRNGRVHALAVTTEGGVIAPGSVIAQVIPNDEKLIVEVRLQPSDIDKVRGGLPAVVKFPAFNAKATPRLEGIVMTVSPAQIVDTSPQAQGRSYFTAQIELAASELARIGRDHALVPGMPAEVYIETVPRSILSYLVKPLVDAMGFMARD